LLFYTNVLI